ncbi:MAG: type II/IV secretion system protein, partial [Proteobacteria bacterium]|nr:type II/IV secretion system protein [Pseudomonadota bacterium]
RCFKAAGCDECKHTGYLGRIGIYEILPMNTELQKMVADYKELNTLRAVALKQGMRSLRISGAQKIAEGLTTLEEIFSVIPDDLDKF